MRIVVQEERPGELAEASPAELLARLDKAFGAARVAVAKSHGVAFGHVPALRELVAVTGERYAARQALLERHVREAIGEER